MLLSIIIPVYNVEKYIVKCLSSIQKQNTQDIEIICIDDGSTDSSGLIIDEFVQQDERFKVFHQKNSGVAAARNKGLQLAQGEYIAWIDPDDYISDDWFTIIEPYLRKKIDVIFFDYFRMKGESVTVESLGSHSQEIFKEEIFYELSEDRKLKSFLCSKVFRHTLLKNKKFDSSLSILEDYSLLPEIINAGSRFYYIHQPLYIYRMREKSLSQQFTLENWSFLLDKAMERFNYIQSLKLNPSKLGYIVPAIQVIGESYKALSFDNSVNNVVVAKKIVNKNLLTIFVSSKISLSCKVKVILFKMNLLKCTYKLLNKMSKKDG